MDQPVDNIKIGIVVAVLLLLFAISQWRKRKVASTRIEIARIEERSIGEWVGALIIGLLLVGTSGVCFMSYQTARTDHEQIVTLLFWIGSCVFWGALLIAKVVSQDRGLIVYRERTPNDPPL